MPKYHFHLESGAQQLDDHDGTDFANNKIAIRAARGMVGELFAEAIAERGTRWFGWTVRVVSTDRRPIATLAVPADPSI